MQTDQIDFDILGSDRPNQLKSPGKIENYSAKSILISPLLRTKWNI